MAVTLAQENGMQVSIRSTFTFRWELEEGWCALVWKTFSFLCTQGNLEGSFPILGTLSEENVEPCLLNGSCGAWARTHCIVESLSSGGLFVLAP